ncbi:MAG TPA: CoA ester lyase [Paracoccaceae bacterium]|nr:CoA ester lyase [Paracoccaceae bacterium]
MARARRSLLFAPATRPEVFEKAMGSGADLVCVDLEDAVAPPLKAGARPDGVRWLAEGPGPAHRRALRTNGLKTRAGLADLLAIAEAAPAGGLVLLPKVDDPAEVVQADAVLSEAGAGCELAALIESVDGLEHAQAIAAASPRLTLLLFGAVDLSAELGCENAAGPLAYARGRCVHAARRAGKALLDVPSLDFRNLDAVRAEAESAKAMGFHGKAAIHPSNVAVINETFTPTAEEIAEAKEIVALYEASESGLVVREGKLIEAPVIRTMQARLAAAEAAGAAA